MCASAAAADCESPLSIFPSEFRQHLASTHGTKRTYRDDLLFSAFGAKRTCASDCECALSLFHSYAQVAERKFAARTPDRSALASRHLDDACGADAAVDVDR
jgi:hypothetical protein